MRYLTHDIANLPPATVARAWSVASFDRSRVYVDLPVDFDFDGAIPPSEQIILVKIAPHSGPTIPASTTGLGDRLERLFKPIARLLDRRFGTRLTECPSCRHRQAKLNRLSFAHPWSWLRRLLHLRR